jgi:hypothetical protein
MIRARGPAAGSPEEPDLEEVKKKPYAVGSRPAGKKEPEAAEKVRPSQDVLTKIGVEGPKLSGVPQITHQVWHVKYGMSDRQYKEEEGGPGRKGISRRRENIEGMFGSRQGECA